MFTGIVRTVGEIATRVDTGGDTRLTIRSADFDFSDFAEGESIAVSGVCLTAMSLTRDSFVADVSRETLAVTTLGQSVAGQRVNLEPSLAVGERLGGHFVTGHVDCIGRVSSLAPDGRSHRLTIEIDPAFARYFARKGSVAVDGVSLTVNSVSGSTFDINIIPHTMSATSLTGVKVNDAVNIEVDLLARYLERLVSDPGKEINSAITREILEKYGYGS